MKTRKFYCKIILALLLSGLLPGSGLLAQQYEKSRTLKKAFPVTDETTVQIINKYGNVHILPTEENSVRFEISIKVESGKQSKVEKTFADIEIEFTESSYYVIAQTVFGNQKNAFWADVSDFTNSMLSGGSSAQIDYTVYIPSNNELSIENKFGNIYMTDHDGKVVIQLSNGDFRGGSFPNLELDHGFGNVVIDAIQSGSMTLSYSEVKLKRAGDIRINSKSSKPNIRTFDSIRLNSKRDTYFFEEAGMINGEASFSYITIGNLNGDLILNTNYGNLNIDHFDAGFSMMNVAARFTDVSMICGEDFNYYLEVYYDSKTRMIYPNEPPIFMNKQLENEASEFLLSGHSGISSDNLPRLKVAIEGGSVNLVHH